MNVEFVNFFIGGLLNVLEIMVQIMLIFGKFKKKSDDVVYGDVLGLIGMVGFNVKGLMFIIFDEGLILSIMYNMLGEVFSEIDVEVVDMVGEIINMICGNVKCDLVEKGYEFGMVMLVVVFGK